MSTPSTLIADRYRLVNLLGSGGMGVVWQAWDERLERPVALKMLRTQPELTDGEREVATKRAMREARITAGLHHPHAVTVFDVVEHEGQPCIVMQLIESTPLSMLLREHGTLGPHEAARIGAQVASALAAAHKMRIVHRDVKPGNILITADGSAMISDFGISHALGDATITATGMVHGTPAYLAPEVARGQPSTFASDMFSLGSTLYAMLEGAPPFGADKNAIALLHRVARGEHPASKHAGALKPLLRSMLSVDPKRRPAMQSIATRLTGIYEDTDAAAASVLPTVPLTAAAPAVPAVDGSPVETAETRQLEATAETQRLAGSTAETERLVEARGRTGPMADARAETERLAGAAASAEVAKQLRIRPSPPAPARPPGHRPTPSAVVEAEPEVHPTRRGRVGAWVGVLLLVGVLVLGGGAFLFRQLLPDAGNAGDARPSETPAGSPTPDAATSPPTTGSPATQPASVDPTPPPPAEEADPPAPTAEQRIVDAVTSYYALVPGDLDNAWSLMTADYQVNHVGGREAYGAFWGSIASVEITDVSAVPPDGARATLTYTFTDGSVVQEVTAYLVVDEGGVLKIAATEVLSSIEL